MCTYATARSLFSCAKKQLAQPTHQIPTRTSCEWGFFYSIPGFSQLHSRLPIMIPPSHSPLPSPTLPLHCTRTTALRLQSNFFLRAPCNARTRRLSPPKSPFHAVLRSEDFWSSRASTAISPANSSEFTGEVLM